MNLCIWSSWYRTWYIRVQHTLANILVPEVRLFAPKCKKSKISAKIPSFLAHIHIFAYTSLRSIVNSYLWIWYFINASTCRNLFETPKLVLVMILQAQMWVGKHLSCQTHSFLAIGGGHGEDMATSWLMSGSWQSDSSSPLLSLEYGFH